MGSWILHWPYCMWECLRILVSQIIQYLRYNFLTVAEEWERTYFRSPFLQFRIYLEVLLSKIVLYYCLPFSINITCMYLEIIFRQNIALCRDTSESGLMDRFETEGTERTNVPGYHYHNDRRMLMTMMTGCTVIRINHHPASASVTADNGRVGANQSETLRHYLTWYTGCPKKIVAMLCQTVLSPKAKSL